MSFQTGLSGLSASSRSLDVIGNNIANTNTTGFKHSRTEFAALVSTASSGESGNKGIGVAEGTIAQQFNQGSISKTNNSKDLAINGNGFFQITQRDGSTAYTRDGQFKVDTDGYLVTNANANVMGYPTDLLGAKTGLIPEKIVLPTSAPIPAKATSQIELALNLDSREPAAFTVIPQQPITTIGATIKAYDSLGTDVPVQMYLVKNGPAALTTASGTNPPATWDIFDNVTKEAGAAALLSNGALYALAAANTEWNSDPANAGDQKPTFLADGTGIYDGEARFALADSGALMRITFDSSGLLSSIESRATVADPWATVADTTALPITLTSPDLSVPPFTANVDLSEVTQFGSNFAQYTNTQDGYKSGEFTGLSIDPKGVITTIYSNGQTQARGQLLLADFRNVQGLVTVGGGAFIESFQSGQPVLGSPGEGKLGALQSGALEDSNVELTSELVKMMTAQRDYQANAQTIKTQDQVMSTLVNLR
ncbi:flagellar hook protein FlgE [Rhodoferax sp. OV413]|uniref:flagellar hook protein FlgE n=1 Tax=Rhodoferax sp. OV413 TaxID=1855285 RepID=UPI0025DBC803|nr:flagellar hook protein FlgE [Rhodoferax sp. OV413]